MKKLFSISFFILLLFITGCNSDQDDNIQLYNGLVFNLNEGEKIVPLSEEISELYLNYFEGQNFQIPLFRYIEKEDYKIYIGLPYRLTIPDLLDFNVATQTAQLLEAKTDTVSQSYKKYQSSTTYTVEYIAQYEGNHIYVLAITDSKETSDNLFDLNKLSARIGIAK